MPVKELPRYPVSIPEKPREPATSKPLEPHKLTQDFQQARQGVAKMQNGALADPRRIAPGPLPIVEGQTDGWHGALGGNRWAVLAGDGHTQGGPISLPLTQIAGNRGGASVMQGVHNGAQTTWFTGGYDNTGLGAAIGETVYNTQDNSIAVLGTGWGNGGNFGAGLGIGWVDAPGFRVSLTGVVLAMADAELQVLADPKAPLPEGHVLMQWRQQSMPVVAVNLSGGYQFYGFGPRLAATRNKEVTVQRYIPKAELAQALRHRGTRRADKVQRYLEGLGWKKSPVQVPAVEALLYAAGGQALQPGESVRYSTCRTWTVGFNGSAYGFRVGSFLTFGGDHEVHVARLDEGTVQVSVMHKRINSVSAAFDTLVATEAYHLSTWAMGASHSFTFDLNHPAAAKAFNALLTKGVLPSVRTHLQFAGPKNDVEIATDMAFQQLPSGVQWVHLEHAERPEVKMGGGLPKPFFLRGKFAGLAYFYLRADATNWVSRGQGAERIQTHMTDKQTQLLHRGTKSHAARGEGVYHTEISEPGHWVASLKSLKLELRYRYDRFKPGAQKQLLRALGTALDEDFPAFGAPAHGQSYDVTVRWPLGTEVLQELADMPQKQWDEARGSLSVRRWKKLRLALTGYPVNARNQATLPTELDVYPYSEALTQFIAKTRSRGFGALYRALPQRRDAIDISVTSDGFADGMQAKVRNLQLAFGDTPTTAREQKAVHKACAKLQKRIDHGLRDVRGDAVLRRKNQRERGRQMEALRDLRVQLFALRRGLTTANPT